MEKRVKDDILSILNDAIEILKVPEGKDIQELRVISDHTIHDASIYQDEFSVEIAVLIYSLYKLLERGCRCSPAQYKSILEHFRKAKIALEQDDYDEFKASIARVFKVLHSLDEKLKVYVQKAIEKARITKGSKLFAHGLSLGTVAKIMNINQWELNNYVGKTQIIEQSSTGMSQRKRFEAARELFGL